MNDHLSVLELDGDTAKWEEVAAGKYDGQFLPYPTFIRKYLPASPNGKVLLDPGKVYWWRITLRNNLPQPIENWVLHLGRSNFTEVYFLDENGKAGPAHRAGWLVPSWEKDFPISDRHNERISFSLPEGRVATLYGKLANINRKEPFLQLRLTPRDFYESWDFVKKTRSDWAFIGFLLAFILINSLLFASTRDRAFLWHAIFQASLFVYLLESFNVLPEMPWLRDHRHALQVFIYAVLCLMDVACIQFIRRYMRMKAHYPVWDKYFSRFEVLRGLFAAGVIAFFFATKNMNLADNLTALFIVGQYSAMAVLLAWLFGKKDKKSLFLIAGTAMFVVGVVLNAVSIMQGTGIQFSYTQFGVVGEVILFTLGLGYRMKILQKEKLEARRLKDLDDFKTRFYTNITHEFRTPLTVIMGNSELGKLDVEKAELATAEPKVFQSLVSNFNTIHRNAGQLLHLINRLLDLSKLQSGKMALNMRQGDIAAFLRYLVESFHPLAANKGIHLHYLSELDSFHMDFDEEKLQDVMTNLLSNAVKFSPPGSEIWVRTKARPAGPVLNGHLDIEVKDNGPGISPEALPYIFDLFFQAGNTGEAGGSGIGLALVKELVEWMGGSIGVVSRVGEGTAFTLRLPIARNAPAAEPHKPSPPSLEFEAAPGQVLAPLPPENSEKPICLVMDDHADVASYLQTLLSGEYAVAVAYDGRQGIEKALELLPDVVISDVMMPEMDGLEVCDFLKNDERTSHIPIILLTAKTSIQDRLEGLRRGADAYLEKPFNRDELFICLKKSLELRQRLLAHFSTMPPTQDAVQAGPELAIEDAFLQKAKKVVEDHLSDDSFDIHRLCRALAMSRAQLHRKLTALTGRSASHFIRSIRLHRAQELLATTDQTVSEIAYEVGFRDPNYFTRTFSEEFGVAPSDTRK